MSERGSCEGAPPVVAEGLTKRYGEVVAVDGLSLRVVAGETYALVGANGAGKSTTFRMLTGLSLPDAGDIRVCGDDMQCPFHGWRWDCEGRNVGIPHSDRVNRSRRIRPWTVAEGSGTIQSAGTRAYSA